MLRVASFNVNGIRAAHNRGFAAWLTGTNPDVVALQELRCPVASLPDDAWCGYHATYDAGNLPGRNGVALLTRIPPTTVRLGIGAPEFDDEGRYVEIDLDQDGGPLTVASVYLPKAGQRPPDERKLARKKRFMLAFARYLAQARRAAIASGREFLVMGDLNVAHTPQDLRHWRANRNNEGFLPEEREWLSSILGPRTLHDVVRRLHPQEQGPYSWWRWGGTAFDDDTGWRIDYQLATPGLARTAVRGGSHRPGSYGERLSDHAAVVVDYAWPPVAGS